MIQTQLSNSHASPPFARLRGRLPLLLLGVLSMGAEECDPLQGPNDPAVIVEGDQPYGSHDVRVPAATYWVNSGLYLGPSETATIAATGQWRVETIEGEGTYGPDGHPTRWGSGNVCRLGELVARVGLDTHGDIYCIGANGTVPARSYGGVVYLAAYGSRGDVYDWDDYRRSAEGDVTAQVTSNGSTVPTILAANAPDYDYASVASGWMEIRGRHVILTVPASLAQHDRAQIPAAVERLDRIYETQAEMRGAVPYHGQRIRFYPQTLLSYGVMLAGNPIRMTTGDPNPAGFDYIDPTDPRRITIAGDNWGFAHELGHTFTVVGGVRSYMDRTGTLESWNNVLTVYAHEQLGITPTAGCNPQQRATYLANPDPNSYVNTFRSDAFLQLCFLMDLREEYGWDIYEQFFGLLNVTTEADIPASGSCPWWGCPGGEHSTRVQDRPVWTWIRDRLNVSVQQYLPGTDVTPFFQQYKIPVDPL